MRNLILALGDQLDSKSSAFDDFDPQQDRVWMAEVEEEATHVWCHKQRLVLFFSAMRHFRDELRERDWQVDYHELQADARKDSGPDFATILKQTIKQREPKKVIVVEPGDDRVRSALEKATSEANVEYEVRADRHFYCSVDEFAEFAKNRKSLLMETFYRQMRKKHDVLMEDDQPVGGEWNLDKENRRAFGKSGPGKVTRPHSFRPDETTKAVMEMVAKRFERHPGNLENFDLPVTRSQALEMLRDFIDRSLPDFGQFEDAMWTEEPFLYHSRLSAPLNLKLLDPRECVDKAVKAYHSGHAPLNSVEGFVRQILGWREFIRGIYWLEMPKYIERNHFHHQSKVPSCYWDGDVDMKCVSSSMEHVVNYGYSHHIHRLMVLGNFSLLLGVHPREFHEWHMAMYSDAIDWVSLPNTLGMSQHGDGGIVGTKPYISTGNYVNKMSNFCKNCQFDFKQATGDKACPITTLYWDFMIRHEDSLRKNHRMGMQIKHVERKSDKEKREIQAQAKETKKKYLR